MKTLQNTSVAFILVGGFFITLAGCAYYYKKTYIPKSMSIISPEHKAQVTKEKALTLAREEYAVDPQSVDAVSSDLIFYARMDNFLFSYPLSLETFVVDSYRDKTVQNCSNEMYGNCPLLVMTANGLSVFIVQESLSEINVDNAYEYLSKNANQKLLQKIERTNNGGQNIYTYEYSPEVGWLFRVAQVPLDDSHYVLFKYSYKKDQDSLILTEREWLRIIQSTQLILMQAIY